MTMFCLFCFGRKVRCHKCPVDFLAGVGVHLLWRADKGIGMSVAAATGIGNVGIAPFVFLFVEPLVYPVASVMLVQLLKRRYSAPAALVSV